MKSHALDKVIMFSGGMCSFLTAHRVVETQGREGLAILFCDTLVEHPDLYRFIDDAERWLSHPIVRIAEGRTPWQVFHDQGMIGNTRADLCSRILKRELADRWVRENCVARPTLYFGFEWTESYRLEGVRRAKPWADCQAPLLDPPYIWKHQMADEIMEMGLTPSQSYADGFAHDNCGGFCIKAGHAHYARLLHKRPDVFEANAAEERAFRNRTGKDVAILRDRTGGTTTPLTLDDFKIRVNAGLDFEPDDEGGCNCFAI